MIDGSRHRVRQLLAPYPAYVLEIRPNCECCDRDLGPSDAAYICTFECTWCPDCVDTFPGRSCPNCGGDLQRRPVRPPSLLNDHPVGVRRVRAAGCLERFATT
jgi:hypothetical protein